MFNILKYEKQHESELLTLLKQEPAWNLFTSELTIDTFREALLTSESYICKSQGVICGYLRALSRSDKVMGALNRLKALFCRH